MSPELFKAATERVMKGWEHLANAANALPAQDERTHAIICAIEDLTMVTLAILKEFSPSKETP